MSYKILRRISVLIISFFVLSLFAYSIKVSHQTDKLGSIGSFIKWYSELPQKIYNVIREVSEPERYVRFNPELKEINKLDSEVIILASRFENSKWKIFLRNLQNDEDIKTWILDEESFVETDRVFSHCPPQTPLMFEDSSIVFASESSNNLYRLNKNSEIVWHITDHRFHHSITLGADSNIWACTNQPKSLYNSKGEVIEYDDHYITKIDQHTGETIYSKSISDIIEANGMDYIIHGMSNRTISHGTDPLHLNDIEALKSNGKYWMKGDLLVSLRNRSMILLLNPESQKIKRVIQGDFFHQHDVDVVSDSSILLFDNHVSGLKIEKRENISKVAEKTQLNQQSRVVEYNFTDRTTKVLLREQFQKESLFTLTQGLQHQMKNGYLLVESQNEGLLYIFSSQELIYKGYLNRPAGGLVEPPHWVSVIE